jgi:hypothetical protein
VEAADMKLELPILVLTAALTVVNHTGGRWPSYRLGSHSGEHNIEYVFGGPPRKPA